MVFLFQQNSLNLLETKVALFGTLLLNWLQFSFVWLSRNAQLFFDTRLYLLQARRLSGQCWVYWRWFCARSSDTRPALRPPPPPADSPAPITQQDINTSTHWLGGGLGLSGWWRWWLFREVKTPEPDCSETHSAPTQPPTWRTGKEQLNTGRRTGCSFWCFRRKGKSVLKEKCYKRKRLSWRTNSSDEICFLVHFLFDFCWPIDPWKLIAGIVWGKVQVPAVRWAETRWMWHRCWRLGSGWLQNTQDNIVFVNHQQRSKTLDTHSRKDTVTRSLLRVYRESDRESELRVGACSCLFVWSVSFYFARLICGKVWPNTH